MNSDLSRRLLQEGVCADCGAGITTKEDADAHAHPAGLGCDDYRVRRRRMERSCGSCQYLSGDGLLCDHHAVADAENDEVGMRDPNADDESVALGFQIIAWDESDEDAGCPGFETT